MKDAIVRGNIAGTVLFVVSAIYAAVASTPNARAVGVADPKVSRAMNGCLAVQILVPLFGLGLNGLGASRNGKFSGRKNAQTITSVAEIGKDVDHG